MEELNKKNHTPGRPSVYSYSLVNLTEMSKHFWDLSTIEKISGFRNCLDAHPFTIMIIEMVDLFLLSLANRFPTIIVGWISYWYFAREWVVLSKEKNDMKLMYMWRFSSLVNWAHYWLKQMWSRLPKYDTRKVNQVCDYCNRDVKRTNENCLRQ